MKQTLTFLKKEFFGGIKTKRLIIACIVFLFIAISSPFLAKILPEILNSSLVEGMTISIPDPTSIDSWTQYYKNLNSIGLLVFIIIFSDIVCSEVEKGSLVNLITKGLVRKNIVLAKFIYLCLTWTILILVSFVISYLYTDFYFKDNLSFNQLQTVGMYWVFGILVNSIIIFASVISKNIYQTLLIIVVFYIAGFGISFISKLEKLNPLSLSSKAIDFISDNADILAYMPAVAISIAIASILLISSTIIFSKKEI